MAVEFIIHAPPTGKARPRVTSHGTYTPKKTKDYEALVRTEYSIQCGTKHFGEKALRVQIVANFAIPKSKPRTIRAKMVAGEIRPTVKSDADNLAKAVLDALNGIAYRDDSQIVSLYVEKWYSETPSVVVRIREVL